MHICTYVTRSATICNVSTQNRKVFSTTAILLQHAVKIIESEALHDYKLKTVFIIIIFTFCSSTF